MCSSKSKKQKAKKINKSKKSMHILIFLPKAHFKLDGLCYWELG